MNELNITKLTDGERMLFAGLCGLAKQRKSPIVTITAEQYNQAVEGHKEASQRLMSLRYRTYHSIIDTIDMNIFSYREILYSKDEVLFRFTDKFYEELLRTPYQEIEDYMSLTGKYPKSLYRVLMRYKNAGYCSIDLSDLTVLLSASKSYDTKELTRLVLRPSVNKLSRLSKFPGLKFYYANEKGRAKKVIFEWDAQTD